VGQWKSGETTEEWAVKEWDITDGLRKAGKHKVTFQYTGGTHRLDIEWAELLEDGTSLGKDEHWATTGARNENNSYAFTVPAVKPGAKYTLRAKVRSDGGDDSNGEVGLLRVP
jgi:hexosaminidase